MYKSYLLPIFVFLSVITIVTAFQVDIPQPTIATSTNFSQVNVNNSQYLQGLTPSQVANLYVETDPSFTSWLLTFFFNYNTTIPAIQHYFQNPADYLNLTNPSLANNFYNKSEVDNLIPSLITYYFWDTPSIVNSSYMVMNLTQNPTVTSHVANSLSNGDVIVYRINKDTNLTGISGGSIHLHTSATKTGGIQDLQIKGILAKRDVNGVVTDLLTTGTSPILVTGQLTNLNLFADVTSPITLNVTDQLLWRLQAVVTGAGTAPSVNITVGGMTQNGLDLPLQLSNIVIVETDPVYSTWYQTFINQQCPSGQVVNGTNSTGGVQCVTLSGGTTTNPITFKTFTYINGSGSQVSDNQSSYVETNYSFSFGKRVQNGTNSFQIILAPPFNASGLINYTNTANYADCVLGQNCSFMTEFSAGDRVSCDGGSHKALVTNVRNNREFTLNDNNLGFCAGTSKVLTIYKSFWVDLYTGKISSGTGAFGIYDDGSEFHGGSITIPNGASFTSLGNTNIGSSAGGSVTLNGNGVNSARATSTALVALQRLIILGNDGDGGSFNDIIRSHNNGGNSDSGNTLDFKLGQSRGKFNGGIRFWIPLILGTSGTTIQNDVLRMVLADDGTMYVNQTINLTLASGLKNSIVDVNNIDAVAYSQNGTAGITDCYDSAVGGQVCSKGGIVTGITDDPSDKKYKVGIQNISLTDCDKLVQLSPVIYQLNDLFYNETGATKQKDNTYTGFIADEVQAIFPELVRNTSIKKMVKVPYNIDEQKCDITTQEVSIKDVYVTISQEATEIVNETRYSYDLKTEQLIQLNETITKSKGYNETIKVLKDGIYFDDKTGKFTTQVPVNCRTETKVIYQDEMKEIGSYLSFSPTSLIAIQQKCLAQLWKEKVK